jgi:hypothetical protein
MAHLWLPSIWKRHVPGQETGGPDRLSARIVLGEGVSEGLSGQNDGQNAEYLGLTGGHPVFVVGKGWLAADEVAPGDAIRNADLRELTVLSVEADTRPQIVHNLEIAAAHTYFAGELEAWGHNVKSNKKASPGRKGGCSKPHRKGKRKSTKDKHEKFRPGGAEKKKAKPGWCQR